MTPSTEQHYIQLAAENPNLLCSEVPVEILEASSADSEPTRFLEEFFATGYTQWCKENQPTRTAPSKLQVNNAIIVLWLRACRLRTCLLVGVRDPDWDKPFFSDAGLYGD
jgi:hypothetical protein